MARNTNGKGFSLKDHLFNKEKIKYLAARFSAVYSDFNEPVFIEDVMSRLSEFELKQRIVLIAEALEKQLPPDFVEACAIIVKALPEPLDPDKTDDDFGSFIFAPLGEYVVRNGLQKQYVDTSLATLKEITQRFSMEDAIRYFINGFEKETMKTLLVWTKDPHYHVRRLVSEGTRPLLPWSGRIGLEVTVPVSFLDTLYADETRFVTRSVANHMNDMSKTHPELVIQTLMKWKNQGSQDMQELDWIVRHSLRTLIKQGNREALELLGYAANPAVVVERFYISPDSRKIIPGETLSFSFEIMAKDDTRLMIDYVIDFVKANGQIKSKVFKLKKVSLSKGEVIQVQKKHKMLADATTFTLYPGKHAVTLQINGAQMQKGTFIIE